MVKLADAPDSKSGGAIRTGSSPVSGTMKTRKRLLFKGGLSGFFLSLRFPCLIFNRNLSSFKGYRDYADPSFGKFRFFLLFLSVFRKRIRTDSKNPRNKKGRTAAFLFPGRLPLSDAGNRKAVIAPFHIGRPPRNVSPCTPSKSSGYGFQTCSEKKPDRIFQLSRYSFGTGLRHP